MFHPLAFTKSFAMIGVALISITVVPALIPTFIRGRLRGEEENLIVRSFIQIYKPLLTWALPRRNLVMWAFAALLIVAAGMFPLQAVVGMGASEQAWKTTFLAVFAIVTTLAVRSINGKRAADFQSHRTALLLVGAGVILLGIAGSSIYLTNLLPTAVAAYGPLKWLCRLVVWVPLGLMLFVAAKSESLTLLRLVTLVSLTGIGLWAYHFPKIGVAFMPALDEGTTLDMPITVPRASVTEAADDLKARDALLRGFPEVESVIGKAGRPIRPPIRRRSTWSKRLSTSAPRSCGRSACSSSPTPSGRSKTCWQRSKKVAMSPGQRTKATARG